MAAATPASLLKTIVVPPSSGTAPTATLIFAHGLGDSGEYSLDVLSISNLQCCSGMGWYDVAQMLSSRPALRHVRFVLPNAPIQPVSLNMGMKVSTGRDAFGNVVY